MLRGTAMFMQASRRTFASRLVGLLICLVALTLVDDLRPLFAQSPVTSVQITETPSITSLQTTGGIFFDDFGDDAINSIWAATIFGSDPTVAETNQRLEITFPANSAGDSFGAGYVSKCQLRGDFDIQVDYSLLVWPSSNGIRIGLGLGIANVVERVSFGIDDFPQYPREVYLTHFSNGVQAITSTNDQTGGLRLVRSGNSLTGYYDSGTWTALNSAYVTTSDVPFSIRSWGHDRNFRDQGVKIAFDNFIVNQGQLICPYPMLIVSQTSSPADGMSAVTVTLTGVPPGHRIRLVSSRGSLDVFFPPSGITDANGQFVTIVHSSTSGTTVITAQDLTTGETFPASASDTFTPVGVHRNRRHPRRLETSSSPT